MLEIPDSKEPSVPSHRSIVLSTAGRRFAPNMLYDATTDQLVPGFTLFDESNIQSEAHPSSRMLYSTDESFKEKTDKLEITGSLKLSVLCGLVKVEGAGKYLTEAKKSHNKERVALYFQGQTRVEKLQIPSTFKDKEHRICSTLRKQATHLVTSVTYGGNAVCVFERDTSSSAEKTEWSGKGSIGFDEMVKKVTRFAINASGEAKADCVAVEDEILKKINFSCFGDFYSDKPIPNNVADAQAFMRELPALIKKESVSVTATLLPLEAIAECKNGDDCPYQRTAKIIRNIESGLLDDVCDYFENMAEVQLDAKRLLQDCHVFSQLEDKVKRFSGVVENYRRTKLSELAELLPRIREGQESHEKLSQMLSKAWNPEALSAWLKMQEQELNHLQICVDHLRKSGAYFTDKREDIHRRLLEIKKPILHIKLPASRGVKFVEDLEKGQCSNIPDVVRDGGGSLQEEDFSEDNAALRKLRSFLERNRETMGKGRRVFVTVTNTCALQALAISPDGEEPAAVFEEPVAPPIVCAEPIETQSIKLQWEEVTNKAIRAVKIEFQEVTNSKEDANSGGGLWQQTVETKAVERPGNTMQDVIESLKSGTKYAFRLWASTDFGLSTNPSEVVQVSTLAPKRCAIFIRDHYSGDISVKTNKTAQKKRTTEEAEQCQTDHHKTGFPGKVFDLKKEIVPAPDVPTGIEVIQSYEVGPSPGIDYIPSKVVLVIGETGTGKTTLLDGVANIYYGVKFEDQFRFRLVDEMSDPEMQARQKKQESLTRSITIYTLNPVIHEKGPAARSLADYRLVLIDTPGFGDTGGIEKDKETVSKISSMLCGDHRAPGLDGVLHGIWFVVKASQTRLTGSEKYVFEQVLSLFGKDTKSAFMKVITFADPSVRPQVLGSLETEKIPGKVFCLNNSMLFADNHSPYDDESTNESTDVDQMEKEMAYDTARIQWKAGTTFAYLKLFEELRSSTGVALIQTKTVLKNRSTLENATQRARERVDASLIEANSIRKLIPFVQTLSKQISHAQQNWTIKVKRPVYNRLALQPGECVTICLECNNTCHYPCLLPPDANKEGCAAMNKKGFCTQCKAKCHWEDHSNSPYRITVGEKEVEETVKELLEKYKVDSGDRAARMTLMCNMMQKYDEIRKNLVTDFYTIQTCLKALRESALRQYPFSIVDHIDKMIFNMEQEQSDGWEEKVKSLTDAKEQAKMIETFNKPGNDVNAALNDLLSKAPIPIQEICEIVEEDVSPEKSSATIGSDVFSYLCKKVVQTTNRWLRERFSPSGR